MAPRYAHNQYLYLSDQIAEAKADNNIHHAETLRGELKMFLARVNESRDRDVRARTQLAQAPSAEEVDAQADHVGVSADVHA